MVTSHHCADKILVGTKKMKQFEEDPSSIYMWQCLESSKFPVLIN